jgi:hypothetical protein
LRLATRAYILKYQNIAPKVRMIYFFSTPTIGSEIASLASLIISNSQLSQMRLMQSDRYLANLLRNWLAAQFNISLYCAYETQPTYGFLIVTQGSAASLCNKSLNPISENHISIVKPTGPRADSYLAFKGAYINTRPAPIQTRARPLGAADSDIRQLITIPIYRYPCETPEASYKFEFFHQCLHNARISESFGLIKIRLPQTIVPL